MTHAYRWSRRGNLPRGLRGKPTETRRAYVIVGTPTKAGVFTFTVTATAAGAPHASLSRRYTIRVR